MTQQAKNGRAPARDFPGFTLEEALAVANGIQDANAGKPMNRLLLANAIGRSAGSSEYRVLLSASFKYGLTDGTEKAPQISLTSLGQKATKPLSEVDRLRAIREAAMKPDLLRRIYEHYDNGKLPKGEFFHNALESQFKVPRDHVEELEGLLLENGRLAGVVKDLAGVPHVILQAGEIGAELEAIEEEVEAAARSSDATPLTPPSSSAQASPRPGQIFLGHGKNKVPLDQLKKVLERLTLPYRVAIDEPHSGRPISEKVAGTMKACSSGIFIFTGDEEFQDKDGNTVRRPSENVIFELGAGSVLYGNKIIVFREEGVEFPSDFKDIGYITFDKDKLDAKASDLWNELIGFGILKLQVA